MSRGKLLTDHDPEAPKQTGLGRCAANGCPLPGTTRSEAAGPAAVCSCHVGATVAGWPLATVVTRRHEALWRAAREASCAGLPDGAREDLAKTLFAAAVAQGLTFNDAQREAYARAGMKLRIAGTIVESAIAAAAIDASMRGAPGYEEERRESPLAVAIGHLRTAAVERGYA